MRIPVVAKRKCFLLVKSGVLDNASATAATEPEGSRSEDSCPRHGLERNHMPAPPTSRAASFEKNQSERQYPRMYCLAQSCKQETANVFHQ
jgi:hypothetical protein